MSSKPQFLFDFGSPNAFLSHEAIPAIEKRTGVKFEYVPILLGGIFKATNNKSPAETARRDQEQARVPCAGNRALHQALWGQAVCLESVLPRQHLEPDASGRGGPVGRRVRKICRGRLPSHVGRAEEDGRSGSGDASALSSSGLDAAKLFARAQDADVKARLIENTQSAVERGAFGSPTFFVGKEMFFGKEQLREVEEMISGK